MSLATPKSGVHFPENARTLLWIKMSGIYPSMSCQLSCKHGNTLDGWSVHHKTKLKVKCIIVFMLKYFMTQSWALGNQFEFVFGDASGVGMIYIIYPSQSFMYIIDTVLFSILCVYIKVSWETTVCLLVLVFGKEGRKL